MTRGHRPPQKGRSSVITFLYTDIINARCRWTPAASDFGLDEGGKLLGLVAVTALGVATISGGILAGPIMSYQFSALTLASPRSPSVFTSGSKNHLSLAEAPAMGQHAAQFTKRQREFQR